MSAMEAILQETVRQAYAEGRRLAIVGSGSKHFLGYPVDGEPLSLAGHRGIIDYEPSELVLTARAGTPLAEIERVLAEQGQMLAFEPPYFGDNATLGGCVACGLSGPRRPFAGSVRDSVLGVKILDGRGDMLRFGGQVMKNVAGYDVSRLMVGAYGTLGVLLEVSLRVLPRPEVEITQVLELDLHEALGDMPCRAAVPALFSAMAATNGCLYLRLAGAEAAVAAARREQGGEPGDNGFWRDLREHRLPFFQLPGELWRVSVNAAAPGLEVRNAETLLDWGGAQRWLMYNDDEHRPPGVFSQAAAKGGHAMLFRRQRPVAKIMNIFHPLRESHELLQQRVKRVFDPAGILNPCRMYRDY
jgi:glycolate oxidase FAD binding subunit